MIKWKDKINKYKIESNLFIILLKYIGCLFGLNNIYEIQDVIIISFLKIFQIRKI